MAHELIQRDAPAVAVQVEPAAAEPQAAPRAAEKKDFLGQRLLSLDVYRGLIMVTLAFSGFGLAATAARHLHTPTPLTAPAAPTIVRPLERAANYVQNHAKAPAWDAVYYQFEHVQWAGCGYWDLIQPSFMFMVGLAAAFSYAKRRRLGQSDRAMFAHAVWRSLVLILLGIFLISNRGPTT